MVLTFRDEAELGTVGRHGAGEGAGGFEQMVAGRTAAPSPSAAAASPLLGIRDGSALGPRRRRRGRSGTAAAGESTGEVQPSRSAGAASS
jgi:hypothetical protein